MDSVGALPDFLVVGAQKAGTTFLYQSLLQHPAVFGAHEREVSFFTTEARYGGAEAYRSHFPPREELPEGAVVGEKSPGYLNGPDVAKRAASVVPEAKIIALLRNPVDRAWSNYQHVAGKLEADPLDFEDALEAEPERLASPERGSRRFGYLARSRYIEYLPSWYEHFGQEQILILQSEDMYERPRAALKRACDFLRVEWSPEYFTLRRGKRVANRNTGRYSDEMKPETRQMLEDYFAPHNERLYQYLGRDFGW